MKFLCGSCKAKYQIADEKISGRTLRMKCRRCGHDIIIKGQEDPVAGGSGSGRGKPVRRRGGSSVGPAPRASRRPGALGADFRRQVSEVPAAPAGVPAGVHDQWHVAINDVPVGPIGRDEVARKVAALAVDGDSLCWREGFDDWRPLGEVPELAALLRQRGRGAPPAPPPGAKGKGVGRGIGARGGSRPRIRPVGRPPSVRPPSNVVPIGGRIGAAAAPALDELRGFDDVDEPTRNDPLVVQGAMPPPSPSASLSSIPQAPSVGPDPSGGYAAIPDAAAGQSVMPPPPGVQSSPGAAAAPYPGERRRAVPVGAWIAMSGAVAFGVAFAAMLVPRLFEDPQPVAQAPAPAPAEDVAPAPVREEAEPEVALAAPEPELVEPTEGLVEPEEAPTTPQARVAGGQRPSTGAARNTKQLTAEEQRLLERMSGEAGGGPSNIQVGQERAARARTGGQGLNAQQLTAVVGRNRPALRRCYEVAVRGMGDAPTVRMDVDVTVGTSGVVTRVRARGNDVGTLRRCIESSVRRWRFPASTDNTQTSFPVVFQPGS